MNAALRCVAAALLTLASAVAARADVDVDVAVGHGGRWIGECVAPVSVTLRNDGQQPAAVRLSLGRAQVFGTPPLRHERAVFLGPGATRREWFLVPAPDPYSSSLSLDLVTEPEVPIHHGGRTATRGRMSIDVQGAQPLANAALPSAGRVIGVIGDGRSVVPALLPNATRKKLQDLTGDLAVIDAAAIDPAALVLAPFLLEGLDAVLLVDPGPSTLTDPEAAQALLDWVALGGLLVVSPGAEAAALGSTPLAPFLPARAGAPEQRDAADVVAALTTETTEHAPEPLEATWLPVEGATSARPFVDRPLGDGRVRLLAFDARAALRACRDTAHYAAVAAVLAGRTEPVRDEKVAESIGQLRFASGVDVEEAVSAILQRGAFTPPPLIVILAALALYVLIVGPVDWIVLRRLGRQRLTTFTFGGAVVVFTAVAYGASFLVFASDAIVNRIVLVDLADSGRDGRRLVRVQDLVGYYSPRGADRHLTYTLPTVLAGAALPGGGTREVGSPQALVVAGADPLGPDLLLQVAFRSQRVVRTVMAGTTGRTIETEWLPGEDGGRPRLRIVNGLPVVLDRVDVLAPDGRGVWRFRDVAPGAEAVAPHSFDSATALGSRWAAANAFQSFTDTGDGAVAEFLGFLSRASSYGFDGRVPQEGSAQPIGLDRQVLLARTGIARGDALHEGRALLLASATEAPLPLPASDDAGSTHALIRMELDLP